MDLGRENTPMSNGTQSANNGIETSKEAPQLPYSLSGSRETKEKEFKTSTDGLHTEPVVCPQKKVLKPPMPPTKETKPTTHELEPEKESCPTKKVCKICLNLYNTPFYRSINGHISAVSSGGKMNFFEFVT